MTLTWQEVFHWFYVTESTIDFYIEEINLSHFRITLVNNINDLIIAKTFIIGSLEKKSILHNYLFYHKDIKNTFLDIE